MTSAGRRLKALDRASAPEAEAMLIERERHLEHCGFRCSMWRRLNTMYLMNGPSGGWLAGNVASSGKVCARSANLLSVPSRPDSASTLHIIILNPAWMHIATKNYLRRVTTLFSNRTIRGLCMFACSISCRDLTRTTYSANYAMFSLESEFGTRHCRILGAYLIVLNAFSVMGGIFW